MRPNVVLALVLLAVGALVFAMLSGGGQKPAEPEGAALIEVDGGSEAARPSSELRGVSERAQTPEEPAVREALPVTDRTVLNGDQQVFTGRLFGTVFGPSGEPVADALLQVRKGAGNSPLAALQILTAGPVDPAKVWTTRSNARGEYSLVGAEPGDGYMISASHPNYAPLEVSSVRIPEVGELRRDLVLNEGFVVLGYVRDFNTGQPIPKARLRLVDLMLSTLPPDDARVTARTAESDDTGLYRFDHVPSGMFALTASAATFGSLTFNDVNVGTQPTVSRDFRLQPGVSMAGQVVTPGRQGIGGARLTAMSDSGVNSQARAVSKPDGSFVIQELTEGTYSLIVEAPGWGTRRLNRIEADAQDVLIEMIQQGTVEGQVIDRASGQPVPTFQAIVRAVIPNSPVYGRRVGVQDVKNDPQGKYAVGGLDSGSYVVEIQSDGYAPTYSAPFEVTQGLVVSGIQVFLSTGGRLVGVVVNGQTGDPVVGAEVRTYDNAYIDHPLAGLLGAGAPRTTTDRSVRTDKEGRFELPYLWPDVYQIQISSPGLLRTIRKDVRVADSSTPTDLGVIRLDLGSSLRGRVTDGAGRPLAGATVGLTATSEAVGFYNTVTNESGAYDFRNVKPGGYRLHATRPVDAANPFASIADMTTSQVNVTLYEGQELQQDLRIASD
jgi:protocatechuate 3,4-dioxygenase beta subunit